ncbi:MAG: ABC transporter ATP-binding protein [Oscillospiraceae bacterium]|nr:ABC transporter ATP-binding protein [Oscillospiraceae bacterium]
MIEVRDAVKKFDGFAALDGANLLVPQGSVYGLVGPNGAGKSTLIRHLTGIYRQDGGTVRVDGQPVWENAPLKARIAAIPDDWYYFMQSTVRDMMRFYKGFYPSFSTERYEKLKEVFNIDEKRAIRRLSKGMQKQVAFWLALSCMPDYLILDEPVDGLDPVMRRQVWSLVMGDVAQRGTTVLVSSHNLRELEDVCDHVGIMDHGKVLLERSLAQLQDNMVKLQVVFQDGVNEVPADLPVLHASKVGRIHTLIMRMNAEEATERLSAYNPLLVDAVPLTLEEIFIYELGGADYAVKDIVL